MGSHIANGNIIRAALIYNATFKLQVATVPQSCRMTFDGADVHVGPLRCDEVWICRQTPTSSREDDDSMFLRKVGIRLRVHSALQPRRPTRTNAKCL
jgi:hypothetical protein